MGEIIYRLIKFVAALSLQILSFSLIVWVLNLKPQYGIKQILFGIGITVLVYLFVSYSLSLFKQVFYFKKKKEVSEILDDAELLNNEKND